MSTWVPHNWQTSFYVASDGRIVGEVLGTEATTTRYIATANGKPLGRYITDQAARAAVERACALEGKENG